MTEYWVHYVHAPFASRVLVEGRHSCAPLTKRTASTLEVRWNGRWRRVYCEGFTAFFMDGTRFMCVDHVLG